MECRSSGTCCCMPGPTGVGRLRNQPAEGRAARRRTARAGLTSTLRIIRKPYQGHKKNKLANPLTYHA